MKKDSIFCKICNTQTKYIIDLFSRYHLKSCHNGMSMKEYYDLCIKKDGEGICVVCGKETTFENYNLGYRKTCSIQCQHKNPDVIKKHKIGVNSYDRDNANENRKRKCKERYGVDHVSQTLEYKEKIKTTCLKKYGSETTLQLDQVKSARIKSLEENKDEINEKRRASWTEEQILKVNANREMSVFEKYGVTHIAKLNFVKEKVKNTMNEKIGHPHMFGSNYLRIKMEKAKRWTPYENLSGFRGYREKVSRFTRPHISKVYENWDGKCYYSGIELNDIAHDRFQRSIDHKISVYYGYDNNIPPEEIGKFENLCVCAFGLNSIKSFRTEEQFKNMKGYKECIENFINSKDDSLV